MSGDRVDSEGIPRWGGRDDGDVHPRSEHRENLLLFVFVCLDDQLRQSLSTRRLDSAGLGVPEVTGGVLPYGDSLPLDANLHLSSVDDEIYFPVREKGDPAGPLHAGSEASGVDWLRWHSTGVEGEEFAS